jgi:hypothetical protein
MFPFPSPGPVCPANFTDAVIVPAASRNIHLRQFIKNLYF